MAVVTFAAMDIGSYEISMKIFELAKKNTFRELNYVRHPLEWGKSAYDTGMHDMKMVDAVCEILHDFKKIMKEFGVSEYRACGTSAFREFHKPMIVIEQIYQRTGIMIEVLSNAEQHFLGYKSIAAIETEFKKMIQKETAILDVGGGNLQVSFFDKDALVSTQSLKMGSLRIRESLKELKKQTLHYDQLVKEFIRDDIMSYQRLYLKEKEIQNVILMGDFLTETIFRENMHGNIITREEFLNRYEDIVYKTEEMLAEEMGIDIEYASLVIPTMVICRSFIDIFNAESLWAPGVSLLDGLGYDFAEKKKHIRSEHNFENDILAAAKNIAKRYSSGKSHIQGTTDFALALFDNMKKVHGMGKRERLLLQIAVLLHDCGKYISLGDIGECSYRIVMATEIVGLSEEERRVIANVVRYNVKDFSEYMRLEEWSTADRTHYLRVAKLTAILRLANAMDRSHYQKVEKIRAVCKDGELHLMIDSKRDLSLELGLLKEKIAFFEMVFGIRLILKRKRRA